MNLDYTDNYKVLDRRIVKGIKGCDNMNYHGD